MEYGDGHNHVEEAQELLPKIFVNPTILVSYKIKMVSDLKALGKKIL